MRRLIIATLCGLFAAALGQAQEQAFLKNLKPEQCAFWSEIRGFAEAGSFQSYDQNTVWQQGECPIQGKWLLEPIDAGELKIVESDRFVTFRMPDFEAYAALEEFVERTNQNIDYRNVAVLTGLLGARIQSTREELHGVRSSSFGARGEALLEERDSLRNMMARIDDLDNDLARQLRGALVSMTLSPGPGSEEQNAAPQIEMEQSIAAVLGISVETAAFRQGDSTMRTLRGVVEMHYVNLDERGTLSDVQSLIEQLKERKLIVCPSGGGDCQMMDLGSALDFASGLPPEFVDTLPSLFLSEARSINDAVFRAFDATKEGHDGQRDAVSKNLKENCGNLRSLLQDMETADVGGGETKMGLSAQALLRNAEFGSCTPGFISELRRIIELIDPSGLQSGRDAPNGDGLDIVVYAMDASQEVPISPDTRSPYIDPLLGTVSRRLTKQADLLKGKEIERRIYVSRWTDHSIRTDQMQKSLVFGVARIELGRDEEKKSFPTPLLTPPPIELLTETEPKEPNRNSKLIQQEWLLVDKAMLGFEEGETLGTSNVQALLKLDFDGDLKVAKGDVSTLPSSILDMIPRAPDNSSCIKLGRKLSNLLSKDHPARKSELDMFVIHSGGIGKCRNVSSRWQLEKFKAEEALLFLEVAISKGAVE